MKFKTAVNKSKHIKHWGQIKRKFQRIVRRDKKAFLNEQCKEIEENNGMGKSRELLKKLSYQGNISCQDEDDKGQKW